MQEGIFIPVRHTAEDNYLGPTWRYYTHQND